MQELFIVTEKRRTFEIEWRLPDIHDPAAFLYWAYNLGARYEIRPADRKGMWLELIAREGTHGEYPRWLYWGHCPWRGDFGTTHKLTQHGLDGLPAAFYRALPRDEPIFRVNARNGLFILTLNEWINYFASGRNSSNLADLAITTRKPERKETRL